MSWLFFAPRFKLTLNTPETVLATAPLAGIEKISPVVAQKLDAAAQNIAQQYHSTVEPAAGQYAQQAADAVRGYLPASLGGKVRCGESNPCGAPNSGVTRPLTSCFLLGCRALLLLPLVLPYALIYITVQ